MHKGQSFGFSIYSHTCMPILFVYSTELKGAHLKAHINVCKACRACLQYIKIVQSYSLLCNILKMMIIILFIEQLKDFIQAIETVYNIWLIKLKYLKMMIIYIAEDSLCIYSIYGLAGNFCMCIYVNIYIYT